MESKDTSERSGLMEEVTNTEQSTPGGVDMHLTASSSVAVRSQQDINQNRHALVEDCWRHQPLGLDQLIAEFAQEISEQRVLFFCRRTLKLFKSGNEFEIQTVNEATCEFAIWSTLFISANYVLNGENEKAVYMMIHSALMYELRMRGPTHLESILVNSSTLKQVRAYCLVIQNTCCVRSRLIMIDILHQTSNLFVSQTEEQTELDDILHTFKKDEEWQSDVLLHSLPDLVETLITPVQLITTLSVHPGNESNRSGCYYNDTTFGFWLRINVIHLPAGNNYFQVVHKGRTLFLSSSKKKTLQSLGITNGDELVIGGGCCATNNDSDVSSKKAFKSKAAEKKRNKKTTATKKKKPKSPPTHVLNDKQLFEQHKQEHSRSMNAVLEALGPILKERRNRLHNLTNKKTAPKAKHHNPKRSNVPGTAPRLMSVDQCYANKAGKVAYPILVGEVSNLYKTSKMLPARLTTIDLHGYSTDEALKKLDSSLPLWVDAAMRGSAPWVLGVDIVCGGGSQTLSGAVKGWIRINQQVANRPKGLV